MNDEDDKKIITDDELEGDEAGEEDEEIATLMSEHGLSHDAAEKAKELIDGGMEEDEAIEVAEEM